MGNAMSDSPPDATAAEGTVHRFSRAERVVHRSIGVLTGVLVVTGAILYFPLLAELVGYRPVFRFVHIGAGLLLPIPVLLALASRAFRTDLRRLNRFTRADRLWLRSPRNARRIADIGKFNAGQKLNSAATAAWIIVMFGTGSMMTFNRYFPDGILTGATLVHDLTALGIIVLVGGHLVMAAQDPIARAGMRTGVVPTAWARVHHPAWARAAEPTAPADYR